MTNTTNNAGNRKSIFIASTKESIDVARAVKANFDLEADVDIWNEDIFAVNANFFTSLLNLSSFYDYAIILFTPDDKAVIREKDYFIPRDNVIYEAGLFMGRLGAERAFLIAEEKVKVLSDFHGIKISTYRHRDNLVAAVGNACDEIRREMRVSEKVNRFSLLPSTSLAIGYYKNFIEKVLDAFRTMNEYKLFEKKEGVRTNEQIRKIKDYVPNLTILLPYKLSILVQDNLNYYTCNLTNIIIEAKSRDFPFYFKGDIYDEGNLNFYDIPTTLLSSLETIKHVFEERFLLRENNFERIEQREIANFEKTLRKLLEVSVGNGTIKFDMLKPK